ncbi:MAG: hypothetical protein JWQ38_3436 [Flavipsychrobacter sp.]|nr:hypothetical protein [Flavipsychrobacter sp.]
MSRPATSTISISSPYDNCLIASCLKQMFTKTVKGKKEPAITISNRVTEVKTELEQLNMGMVTELTYGYLAAMEQTLTDSMFRYIVIYRNEAPVLFCYFQLVTLTSHNFSFEKNKSFVKSIFRLFLDLKKAKVLVSGNALRNDIVGYTYNESVLDEDEAMEIMVSAAERLADEEHVTAVILKDLPVSKNVWKWMGSMNYHTPWNDQVMTLDVQAEWQSIEDYISALSRKYRTRANKILATRKGITIQALTGDEIKKQQMAIHSLFLKVAESQPFVLAHVGAAHFSRLKEVYGDNFEVIGFYKENKLVGFYSGFVSDDAYELYYIGFDYNANTEHQLYFNILFSGLERAIRSGKKQLKLGRTSFDAKASIGAKAANTNYFIKTANISSVAINWFANYFSTMEDGKWKLRNPFK